VLSDFSLRVHTRLSIFICVSCKTGLACSTVAGHLENKHNRKPSAEQAQAILDFGNEHNVVETPPQSPLPANNGPPVEFIKSQSGYACSEPDCPYACGTQGTMREHLRTGHAAPQRAPIELQQATVQTLFDPTGSTYFVVNPALAHVEDDDEVLADLTGLVMPAIQTVASDVETNMKMISPFHRTMHWHSILGKLIEEKDGREAIMRLVAPVDRKKEPILAPLQDLLKEYYKKAGELADAVGPIAREVLVPEK